MSELKFAITGDNTDLMRKMQQVIQTMENTKTHADATGFAIKDMLKQTAAFAGISLGAAGLKEFVTKMVDVRKEIQGFQTSFNVLLGDQQKATAMFNELKQFATTTPMMLKDLSSAAQTMLGFGIESEKVVPILKQIGDVSMGDSQRFNSLVLAFSQMSATGKLMGQDLMQMINAGFNPLNEIARKTGKSIATLKDEMSAGAISAEMVADAFKSVTSEGGPMFGMLEEQGKGIAGQMNELSGAINDMFNKLGTEAEPIITGTIQALTSLVQNYEAVGKAIAVCVASYGAYKTALMATVATEALMNFGLKGGIYYILSETKALKAATVAQKLFNAACNANPYVLAATAIVAVGTALWAFSQRADDATKAQEKLNSSRKKFLDEQQKEKEAIQGLLQTIQDQASTDSQRIMAYNKLSKSCSAITDKYTLEQLKVVSLTEALKELANQQERVNMQNLADDTNLKVRVYNDLARVHNKKQVSASAETQAFIKANGLEGISFDKVLEMLKKQIDEQRAQYNQMQAAGAGSEQKQEDNKEYWENLKKQAEAELSALSSAEAAGKKGAAIWARIQKIKEKLKPYNEYVGATSSKDAAEAKRLQEQQQRERQATIKRMRLETAQVYTDAEEDSFSKQLSIIKLNYAKEINAIEEWEQQLREKKIESAKKLFEADPKNKNKVFENSSEYKDLDLSLSKEEQKLKNERERAATIEYEKGYDEIAAKQSESLRQYYKQYGTYLEQKTAIQEEYEQQLEEATRKGDEGQVKTIQEQFKQAMYDIDMDQIGKQMDWLSMFDAASPAFASMLQKSIKSKRSLLDFVSGKSTKRPDGVSDETIEKLKGDTNALLELYKDVDEQEKLLEQNSVLGINNIHQTITQLTKAREYDNKAIEEGRTEEEKLAYQTMAADQRAQALQNIANQANNVTSAITNSIRKMKEFAKAIGDTDLEETATQLESFAQNHQAAADAWASSGNPWSALIGGLSDMLNQFSTNLVNSKVEAGQLATYYKDWNRSIKQMSYDIDDKEYDGIFGTQSIKKAQDALKNSKQLLIEYRRELSSLYNMNVQTKAAKYFLGFKTSSAEYENLYKLTSGKIFKDGELDVDAAKEFLSSYSQITEEQRKQIQYAIDLKNEYDELVQTVDDLISDTFSSLASDITDQLFDAARSGSDFWASFHETGSDVISQLGHQLIQEMYIQTYLDSFKDRMQQAYLTSNASDTQKQLTSIMTDIFNGFESVYTYAYEAAQAWDDMATAQGWDIPRSDATASRGVTANASQQTIDEANGRMAAIQMGQQTIIAQGIQVVNCAQQANSTLADILTGNALRNATLADMYTRMGIINKNIADFLQQIADNTKNI